MSPHADERLFVTRRRAAQPTLLAHSTRTEGHAYQVFLLSSPEDSATVTLPNPIVNTTKAASGRSWAWTLGQRYTSLASLLKYPATTTDLDAIDTG